MEVRIVDNGLQSDCEAMRKVEAEDLKTCGSHFNNFRPTNHSLRGFDGFPPGANIPVVRVHKQPENFRMLRVFLTVCMALVGQLS